MSAVAEPAFRPAASPGVTAKRDSASASRSFMATSLWGEPGLQYDGDGREERRGRATANRPALARSEAAMRIRPARPEDTPALKALTAGTGVFKEHEVEVLQEVLDDYHAR